jgi:hypothetical protein
VPGIFVPIFIDKNLGGGNRYFDKTDEEWILLNQIVSAAILHYLIVNAKKIWKFSGSHRS